jgi:hypothetical protein
MLEKCQMAVIAYKYLITCSLLINERANFENPNAKLAKSNGILVDNQSKYGHNIHRKANCYLANYLKIYSACN